MAIDLLESSKKFIILNKTIVILINFDEDLLELMLLFLGDHILDHQGESCLLELLTGVVLLKITESFLQLLIINLYFR